jgi:hypothetical protein
MGEMFTPSITPGVNTLYCSEEWRGEQRISPPGDNFAPGGHPGGEVKNGPMGVHIILFCLQRIRSTSEGKPKYFDEGDDADADA